MQQYEDTHITLKLSERLGSEIRSRITVERIYEELNNKKISCIDLSGIDFITRGVADELYNIQDRGVSFINASSPVQCMLDIVANGRTNKRQLRSDNAKIIKCNNMEELEKLFQEM